MAQGCGSLGGCCLWASDYEHTNPIAATTAGSCCKQSPGPVSGILKNGHNSELILENQASCPRVCWGHLDFPWISLSFCFTRAANSLFHLELTQHFSSWVYLETFIVSCSPDLVVPFPNKIPNSPNAWSHKS